MKDIIVIRHKKENLRKCSLRYFELHEPERSSFFRYPLDENVSFPKNGGLLHLDGQILPHDFTGPLIVLDATWRYASVMYTMTKGLHSLTKYALPAGWVSAYPRRQEDCTDPSRGLASIEALFVACLITGRATQKILDGYYWKEQFLQKNENLIKNYI